MTAPFAKDFSNAYGKCSPKERALLFSGLSTALGDTEKKANHPARVIVQKIVSSLEEKLFAERLAPLALVNAYEDQMGLWNNDPEAYVAAIKRTPVLEFVTRDPKEIKNSFKGGPRMIAKLNDFYKGYSDPATYISDLKVLAGYMQAEKMHVDPTFSPLFNEVLKILESSAPPKVSPFDPEKIIPGDYRERSLKSASLQDGVDGFLRVHLEKELASIPKVSFGTAKNKDEEKAPTGGENGPLAIKAIKRIIKDDSELKRGVLTEMGLLNALGQYRLPEEISENLANSLKEFSTSSGMFEEMQAKTIKRKINTEVLPEKWETFAQKASASTQNLVSRFENQKEEDGDEKRRKPMIRIGGKSIAERGRLLGLNEMLNGGKKPKAKQEEEVDLFDLDPPPIPGEEEDDLFDLPIPAIPEFDEEGNVIIPEDGSLIAPPILDEEDREFLGLV